MSHAIPSDRALAQPLALCAAVLIALLVGWQVSAGGARLTFLFVVGLALGLTLYHAAFGFGAAYRRLIVYGEVDGVLAQLLMIGLATLLFAPFLSTGEAFGRPVAGAVAPAGLQVACGAFLFGIGMQLGGGCGSGTLFTVGGGSTRSIITLGGFVAGSFWASLHMPWWWSLPSLGAVSFGRMLGWPVAVAAQLALLGVLAALLWKLGRRRRSESSRRGPSRALYGPWPLAVAAVVLAVLNLATLWLAGHPWTITWAFTLWGAKAAALLGWDPAASAFWQGGFQSRALTGGVLADVTSVMDIGIVVGALAAASLAGRFAPRTGVPAASAAAAVIGGLAMGYGARIGFGCNIGAFFSGAASLSLHAWLWIAAALGGCWVGVVLRPRFGLEN